MLEKILTVLLWTEHSVFLHNTARNCKAEGEEIKLDIVSQKGGD